MKKTVDYNLVFRSIPSCSVLLDIDAPKYSVLAVTDEYCKVSKRSCDDLIGNSLFDVFPQNPESLDFSGHDNLIASFQKIISEKTAHQLPIQRHDITDKAGSFEEHYWQVTNKPVLDSDGQVKYIIHTAENITDKIKTRQQEEILEEKNLALQMMNQELESFAYISSHDLQEPLRKIQIFASRIIENEYENLSEAGKDFFGKMQRAAFRMQTLIDDLLTYSRTNSEDRKFEKVDLLTMIEEIKEEISEDLEVYQAEIEILKTCKARIIPFQFRQLMLNLIGNALKFSTPERRPHITISCSCGKAADFAFAKLLPEKDYCHIRISDNGIGFEPEYGDKIFQVFQRLHSREKYNGTGIGLAIVRKIVDNHDGFITATGKTNQGATFDIYLPC